MSKMVILGAQESGTGAAILAMQQGYKVFVSDSGPINERFKETLVTKGIEFEEGTHTMERILAADEVVKSPGIPERVAVMKEIRSKGIPVLSEIEFAARYTDAHIIGITGSNGKTTTTMLIYHILKKAGLNVGLAGNVGSSFAKQVAEENYSNYVIELSSFQLDDIHEFRPDIGVLLNITPDHLDRYENDFNRYAASKFRITMNQSEGDHFIYCMDDETIATGIHKFEPKATMWPFSLNQRLSKGGYSDGTSIHFNTNQTTLDMSIMNLALEGKHNVYNSLAAGLSARVLELRDDVVRESLSDFQNVPHRLEEVATVNGIEYINDSKATNVNATWYALESMKKPVIWIAGGTDKGNDYKALKNLVRENVKMIICIGKDNTPIVDAFSKVCNTILEADGAYEAVQAAAALGLDGDVVLLSPACASFDRFKNYEDRGDQFKHAVHAL